MTINILDEERQLERECYEEDALINLSFFAELNLPYNLQKKDEIYSKYQAEKERNLAWLDYKKECLHNSDRRENWGKGNLPDPIAPEAADDYLRRSRLLAMELKEQEKAELEEENAEFAVILAIVTSMCDATAVAVRASAIPDHSANIRRLLNELRKLVKDPLPTGGGSGGGSTPIASRRKPPSPKPRKA